MKKAILILNFLLGSIYYVNAQTETPRILGGDVDNHGCRPSAGYQWSRIKGECIRLFDSGIRLNPKLNSIDQTLSAFIVFKSTMDQKEVEIFIPNAKNTIILKKSAKKNTNEWRNKMYKLTEKKGIYTLENVKKTLLYQSEGR